MARCFIIMAQIVSWFVIFLIIWIVADREYKVLVTLHSPVAKKQLHRRSTWEKTRFTVTCGETLSSSTIWHFITTAQWKEKTIDIFQGGKKKNAEVNIESDTKSSLQNWCQALWYHRNVDRGHGVDSVSWWFTVCGLCVCVFFCLLFWFYTCEAVVFIYLQ